MPAMSVPQLTGEPEPGMLLLDEISQTVVNLPRLST